MTEENREPDCVPMTPSNPETAPLADEKNADGAGVPGTEKTAVPKPSGTETPDTGAQEKSSTAAEPSAEAGETSGNGKEHSGNADETSHGTADTSSAPENGVPETFTLSREQMEQLESSMKQLETLRDQFLRLSAEYDNYRKRTSREKEALWQDAKIDTIRAFLGVYDNLERAVKAGEGDEESPHFKGLVQIFKQYQEILKNLGVTEIDAKGQPFDPERHNAVMHIDDEQLGENTVAQVFQTGFELGNKVVRHAAVQVAN